MRSFEDWTDQPLQFEARSFVKRFQTHLAQSDCLPRGSKILLAVSGGPDSQALLFLLARLAPKYDWNLAVAHVNYHLRGKDSEKDFLLVKETATKLRFPFFASSSRKKPTKNIEAALRDIRYAFFEKVRNDKNFDILVTAHTKNDLAETFLLNLLRGSGSRGLSPFQISNPVLVRPLLPFTRKEILAFLDSEHLPYRIDKSNSSFRYTRNRIRHSLLPRLEKEFNPNLLNTLARTANILSQKSPDFLPFFVQERGGQFIFDRPCFLSHTAASQRTFLTEFFRHLLKKAPSGSFIDAVQKMIASPKRKIGRCENRDLKIRTFYDKVETTLKR